MEEHIAVFLKPGHRFLSHLSPKSSSAKETNYYLVMNNDAKEIVQGIKFDSTAVNTETKHECISQLEDLVDRLLQWFICLLHTNELPKRHLISKIYGKTSM